MRNGSWSFLTFLLGTSLSFASIAKAQQPASPPVPTHPPLSPHAFWDRTNILLFSGIAVFRGLDYASTRNFQARGREEILIPDDVANNSAGFASRQRGSQRPEHHFSERGLYFHSQKAAGRASQLHDRCFCNFNFVSDLLHHLPHLHRVLFASRANALPRSGVVPSNLSAHPRNTHNSGRDHCSNGRYEPELRAAG